MDHRAAKRHNGEVPAESGDSGRVVGQVGLRKRIRFQAIVEIFVLAENDWVVDLNRLEQHRVGILDGGRRHHDQPGEMAIE